MRSSSSATGSAVLLAACVLGPHGDAGAQVPRWPAKPVRVVVPFAPGGGIDAIARMVSGRLSEDHGQQFVVDNRPGAGGTIGAEIGVRATPDGYTLTVVSASYSANAALYKLPYDPVRGITPISMIAIAPRVLVVHPSVKAGNVKELIDLARARPSALNFGTSGAGSIAHLATELFQQMAKVQMLHVPYKGDGPALVDLLGGQIQVFFGGTLPTLPHVRSGRLRGLGVSTEQRSSAAPDLPAIAESLPGFAALSWFGIWGPAGMPRDIVRRIDDSLGRFLKSPEVGERLRSDGAEPAHSTPDEFARLIEREIAVWSKVVKAGRIKGE
jgi:tripartite-type tricarboxylate transporter receptor subunit TctC